MLNEFDGEILDRDSLKKEIQQFHRDEPTLQTLDSYQIVFHDEKLVDLVDWNPVLEKKKLEFRERMKIVPKYRMTAMYDEEIAEILERYDPGVDFRLDTYSFYLINKGQNLTIDELLTDRISNIKIHSIKYGERTLYYYALDKLFDYRAIADGISQAYYLQFLYDIRDEFYPLENDLPINERRIEFTSNNIEWVGRGKKTEIAELIYAITKLGVLRIKSTGDLATMEEVKALFESTFGITISNVNTLVTSSFTTFKKADGEKLFTQKLYEMIKNYKDS